MKHINIPETVGDYVSDLHDRALPDKELREHDFYSRLAGWVMDNRAPILYEQDNDSERTNFSINFNWLSLRDYQGTSLGPAATIATMYALHEMSHMTYRLPTRFDKVSAEEYAEDFTKSEYRASNETEALIHYRVPGLRGRTFPSMKIGYDMLRDRGIDQPTSHALSLLRPLLIETDLLDDEFKTDEEKMILDWFKTFGNNREWAVERFAAIGPFFRGMDIPQSIWLTDSEYEPVISSYEPQHNQLAYEQNMSRNVRMGYAMCGLAVPKIAHFQQARELAKELEGYHARTQD